MSLYRQALKLTLNSLHTDRERHIMKEVLCLICASHNGVSESEVLDLFPEMEPPLLSTLLHRLTRVCVVALRCGIIRFQHLEVTYHPPRCSPLRVIVTIRANIFDPICVFFRQAWEAVRLEFLDGGINSAAYREKLIRYFSQQLRWSRGVFLHIKCQKNSFR